jgi:putative transposase
MFQPGCIIFDSWYSSIENLKLIRSLKWHWCTRLKSNRLVNPDHSYNRNVSEIDIPPEGRVVHLCQYGFIKVFRIVHSDKEPEHWATDILDASESDRKSFKDLGWNIEVYHRGIKPSCGIERCQGRKEIVQRGHIFLSLLAFLRLESPRLNTGSSCTSRNARFIDRLLLALSHHQLSNLFFTGRYDDCLSLELDPTA